MFSNAKRLITFSSQALIGTLFALSGISAYSQNIRLMPLGASITAGVKSSSLNGYRAPLRNLLIQEVDSVDFVGSIRSGNMSDSDHEGHSGMRIDEISRLAAGAVSKYRPNVVTLLVGTNDMGQSFQTNTAPERLGQLIDIVLASAPDATVLVSEIVPSANAKTQVLTAAYNARIPGIVQIRANAGQHVAFVSLAGLTQADLSSDGIHPQDNGYLKIANAWHAAIDKAILAGWIKDPVFAGNQPSNGPHSLRPKHAPSMALDNFGGHLKAGNPIDVWGINPTTAQTWNFSDTNVAPKGYYKISASTSSFCLTASGSSVNLQTCNGSSDQAWRVAAGNNGYAVSPASNTGLCLDVKGASAKPGASVLLWTCKGSANQLWDIK